MKTRRIHATAACRGDEIHATLVNSLALIRDQLLRDRVAAMECDHHWRHVWDGATPAFQAKCTKCGTVEDYPFHDLGEDPPEVGPCEQFGGHMFGWEEHGHCRLCGAQESAAADKDNDKC